MLSRALTLTILVSSILTCGYVNAASYDEYRVTKVIDGDTILLENGEHIRYIGMDTPEKGRPYYEEVRRENERLVKGKRVRLEYDVGRSDRYGRTLAYVYVGGIFVNAELVKNGYAMIYTFPPNVKYADRFLELQEEARREKRGLWGLSQRDIELIKNGHRAKQVTENQTLWDYLVGRMKTLFR